MEAIGAARAMASTAAGNSLSRRLHRYRLVFLLLREGFLLVDESLDSEGPVGRRLHGFGKRLPTMFRRGIGGKSERRRRLQVRSHQPKLPAQLLKLFLLLLVDPVSGICRAAWIASFMSERRGVVQSDITAR